MTSELARRGYCVNHKRTERLMASRTGSFKLAPRTFPTRQRASWSGGPSRRLPGPLLSDRLDAWLKEWGGNPAGETLTVADVLDRFLGRYEKRVKDGKSPKTLEQYRWAAAHVRPHLGSVVADHLTPTQVEKFLDGKEKGKLNRDSSGKPKPLSDRSVKALRGVLNQAYTEAVKRREVMWNPVAATDAIHVGETDREALSPEQVASLLDVAAKDDGRRFSRPSSASD